MPACLVTDPNLAPWEDRRPEMKEDFAAGLPDRWNAAVPGSNPAKGWNQTCACPDTGDDAFRRSNSETRGSAGRRRASGEEPRARKRRAIAGARRGSLVLQEQDLAYSDWRQLLAAVMALTNGNNPADSIRPH